MVSASPPHRTPAERAALGKAARAALPRSDHAAVGTPASTRDPVELLERQAANRVPELVPIRYGRMLASPLGFFRGAATVMAHDLAATPNTGLRAQLCGDAHLSNFGLFASPERRLVFDLNDFDETLPGPWEWDVKRLAASLAIAARDNGVPVADRRRIVLAAVGRYRAAMRDFAESGNLAVWYASVDAEMVSATFAAQLSKGRRKRLARALTKAHGRDHVQALDKLTRLVDGQPRIVADPPLIVPIADLLPGVERDRLTTGLRQLIVRYAQSLPTDRRALIGQYTVVDIARKVVGVGSVGTRAWVLVLLGRDETDPLVLQAKEAQPSVLAQYAGDSEYANEGQRVVAGQRLMQAASDIFLGWQRVGGIDGGRRDFYVRQLRDWKGAAVVETMTADELAWYGAVCGWTLARAHARSGDRIAIAAYLGGGDVFDRAVAEFAEAYADRNERDYAALAQAANAGRIAAQVGV
jgi:uncharacterized protein (DUF2252 family)